MPPFRFRLEQVRLYRKQLEERAMQVVANALMAVEAARIRVEALEQEREALRERLCRPENMTPPELWLARTYSAALQEDIAAAKNFLAERENELDRCREELVRKARDRSLLDTLKDKQHTRHQHQERQLERKVYDETATLRYKPAPI